MESIKIEVILHDYQVLDTVYNDHLRAALGTET